MVFEDFGVVAYCMTGAECDCPGAYARLAAVIIVRGCPVVLEGGAFKKDGVGKEARVDEGVSIRFDQKGLEFIEGRHAPVAVACIMPAVHCGQEIGTVACESLGGSVRGGIGVVPGIGVVRVIGVAVVGVAVL